MELKKKVLTTIFLLGSLILIVLGIYLVVPSNENEKDNKFVNTTKDGTKINNSELVNKKRNFDGLDIDNIKFYYVKAGMSIIEFEAINSTETNYKGNNVIVNILDENNNLIQTIVGVIPEIASGKSEKLTFSIDKDVVNAYDLSFRVYNIPEEDFQPDGNVVNQE